MATINLFNIEFKKRTPKFLFTLMVGLVILFSVFSYPGGIRGAEIGDNERVKSLIAKARLNPADNEARWGLAQAYFEQAGFKDYFQARSWLWTENTFKIAALNSKLPTVLPQMAQYCKQQLLAILDSDPGIGPALTMAGDYHYYYNQKEIALWYYRRAVELNPDSTAALLALADFYLSEWQPAKVLELLSKHGGPEFSLRKGISGIQSGEYQLALGYLLQADLLPSGLQATKELNLFKVYLALGDYSQSRNFQAENFQGVIPATLFKELQGWSAFLAGDFKAAEKFWNEGVKINPDYYFWQSNQLGRGNLTPTGVQSVTNFKRNKFFQAAAWILQGRLDMASSDPGASYRDFLAGIKADHLSLVGFLAASRIAFREQEYEKALDLLGQGLAVNSKFGPLLLERAKVYEALGRFHEAARDREAARTSTISKPVAPSPLSLVPAWKAVSQPGAESINIVIRGNTRDLAGFWVSGDGIDWDWIPYWGGPMVIPSRLKQGWWLPAGPGLSGQAYYLDNLTPDAFSGAIDPPGVTVEGRALIFKFPVPVKLVVPVNQGGSTGISFVSEQFEPEHTVPIELFGRDNQAFACWFQTMNGVWNWTSFNINIAGSRNKTAPENQRNPEIEPDGSTKTAFPPKLSSVLVADALPDGYQIVWSADQAASSSLWVLSDRSVWSEVSAVIDLYGHFTAFVPKTAVFCRIGLKSEADGAIIYRTVPELNRRLSQNRPYRFTVNDGLKFVNSRNVVIRPALDNTFSMDSPETQTNPQFQWSLSNDQRVWSPWHQGFKTCPWRLNSAEGEQLVYIRYKLTGDQAQTQIAVIPVILDTLPPEVETYNWEFGKNTGSQTKVMAINFKFSEPVLLKALIPKSGKSTTGTGNDSNNFQLEFTVDLPMEDPSVTLEFTVLDQAGNETRFTWQAGSTGLFRKSDNR
jgi:tetratricopeptide (TPR) repeat protein